MNAGERVLQFNCHFEFGAGANRDGFGHGDQLCHKHLVRHFELDGMWEFKILAAKGGFAGARMPHLFNSLLEHFLGNLCAELLGQRV